MIISNEKAVIVRETSIQDAATGGDDVETGLHRVVSRRASEPRAQAIQPIITEHENVTYPEGGIGAWLVVFGSFTGMLSAFGLMNSIGIFSAYVSKHQLSSQSDSSIAWIFSIYIFLSFFCGLLVGPVFDAKGARGLVASGSILLLGGTFALAESKEYWHFILSMSCGGLGTALIFTPAFSAIAHFFCEKRGLATGLAATGGPIGGIVFPFMLEYLLEKTGWAWAIRSMGFVFLGLLVPANILIRTRLPPLAGGSIWPDVTIFGQLDFALATAGVFFMEWGLFIPVGYLTAWALSIGVDEGLAIQLVSIYNAASFFGRWGPGFAADKIGRFNTMILMMFVCGVACLVFWLPPSFGAANSLAMPFAIVFGFSSGSNISLTPVCIGQLCKTQEYGRYYASCYTIVSLGTLTGLPIVGATMKDGYFGAIFFTAACYFVGTGCLAIVRGRRAGWSLRGIF